MDLPQQTIGGFVPGFDLPAIDGRSGSLAESLAGRQGAVVVFWSGICSHCQRYDAYLSDFTARHGDLALLAIASRQAESTEEIQRVATRRQLTFPILHDSDQQVARDWFVEQTPRVFLIDDSGRLRYRGAIDNFKYPSDSDYEPYLESAIADFLSGRQIGRAETPSFGCPIQSVYYQIPRP